MYSARTHTHKVNKSELRKFGLLFSVLTVFYLTWSSHLHFYWSWRWLLPFALASLALLLPSLLAPVYWLWSKIGYVLGRINQTLLLCAIFLTLIIPIGVLLRCFKRLPMRDGFDNGAASYRVSIAAKKRSMKTPF